MTVLFAVYLYHLTRYFSTEVKTFQTCFPFTTIWGCQCVKLCSFNDPCGETAVAAASSNKEEEERRRVEHEIRKEKMDVMNTALLTFPAVRHIKWKICKWGKKRQNWVRVFT